LEELEEIMCFLTPLARFISAESQIYKSVIRVKSFFRNCNKNKPVSPVGSLYIACKNSPVLNGVDSVIYSKEINVKTVKTHESIETASVIIEPELEDDRVFNSFIKSKIKEDELEFEVGYSVADALYYPGFYFNTSQLELLKDEVTGDLIQWENKPKETTLVVKESVGLEAFNEYSLFIPVDENFCSIFENSNREVYAENWKRLEFNGCGDATGYEMNNYKIDDEEGNDLKVSEKGDSRLRVQWIKMGIGRELLKEEDEEL